MSKGFYEVLAQELCSLKNSPFSMMSNNFGTDSVLLNRSHIRKSTKLSQDPDRLFDPQKSKRYQQSDFVELQRQQKQHLEQIQIELLKQKTQEQLKRLKDKLQMSKGYSYSHPYSIFKCQRTVCLGCSKCYEYNGNFNMGVTMTATGLQHKQVEYLCCITCGCPMNSHEATYQKNKFSSQIFSYLSTAVVQPQQLNQAFYPICFAKPIQNSAQTLIKNLFSFLPQLGFQILSYRIMEKKAFELFMIKKEILAGVEKDVVEKLWWFVSYLEKDYRFDWKQSMAQHEDQGHFDLVKKLREKIKLNLSKEDDIVIFFVKNINSFQSLELWQIMSQYSQTFGAKFLWTPNQPKQIFLSSCILFPEHFRLNHQTFILPSEPTDAQIQKTSARFKDLLDFNNYATIGQIKKIQVEKLEKIMKSEDHNKINYVMGQDKVNSVVKRVRILLTAKVGPPTFTVPFKNAVDFIELSSQSASFSLTFPEYLRSQRCMIILRPCFSLSGFDEVVMTMLRINNFVLLKRRQTILTRQEARYVATLEKVDDSNIEAYIKMMTSGAVEIVLVSKRAAMYEANILLNGSKDYLSDTKTKPLKQFPTLKIKRGTQTYQYIPQIKPYEFPKNQCFSSVNELFRIQNILFPKQFTQTKFMTNQRSGDVLKFDSDKKPVKQYKASSKVKESMLTEIKKDTFNYWAYVAKSQFFTEELAGIFMPETTLFESCVVIVKPGFVHLTDKIAEALMEHRYHIIMQKTVQLSQKLAYQLIQNLNKTKSSPHDLKTIVQAYSSESIHIFCISKVFAKQEMFSILSQFSFLSEMSTIVVQWVDDKLLKQSLVPVWNNPQFVLKILSSPLYNIEQAIHSLYAPGTSNEDKFEILRYIIGSYYGVKIQDMSLKSIIGKFSYYITSPQVANLQSWFYSELCKSSARYVPTLFQHRLIGETCFVVQTESGYPFLNIISVQYEEEKQKVSEIPNQENRKSLILFLWGKQMAKFMNQICSKEINMKGWGRLTKKNQEWQGRTSESQCLRMQRQFLQSCEQKFSERQYEIQTNIQKVRQSRYLTQKYSIAKYLIPFFPENKIDECIRIIETQETSKLHFVDKYSMIDPDHEKSNQKSLYTLNLYNVEPSIGTKVELIAEVMVFLLKLQHENLEHREMFKLLFEYFVASVLEFVQADIIECEFYIRQLRECVIQGEQWLLPRLRTYPNFKKLAASINSQVDEISGKKRKFLEKRQYYKDIHSTLQQQRQLANKQYKNFNLNYEVQQRQFDQTNPLLNMKDPFHRKIVMEERNITLLRENQNTNKQKPGIYVEFEKKITENEELLMTKIKGQVDRFHHEREEKILYETGLENQLWYRKTKGEEKPSTKSKLDDAIQKQISKLMQFKKTDPQDSSSKFYQTK